MYIEWSPVFEIGVRKIDSQHRHLAALINEFHEALTTRGNGAVFPVLNRLVQYVEEHFRDEEALMTTAHFPDLPKHRIEHEKLTREIFLLAEKHASGVAEIGIEVMEFLKNWLLDHILHQDKQLERHFETTALPAAWA